MMYRQVVLSFAFVILATPVLAQVNTTTDDSQDSPAKVIEAPVQTIPKFGSRTDSSPKFGASTGSSPKFGAATDRNSIAHTRNDFPKSGNTVVIPSGSTIVIHKHDFKDLDKDRSDTIDLQEFEANSDNQNNDNAREKFSELDTDQDNVLSPDEFKKH